MTFAEALAKEQEHYGCEKTNPRWVCCHAAFGRRPKAYEFIIWNTGQWWEFIQEQRPGFRGGTSEFMVALGVDKAQAAYDVWLIARVPATPLPPEADEQPVRDQAAGSPRG